MNVLAVDDNPDILSFVKLTVEMMGHQFDMASGGREGLEKILNNDYDAVFMDLHMPEFNGKDVIDVLIEKGKMKDQAVILFTASYIRLEEISDDLLANGLYKVLQKPADIEEIIEILNDVESGKES